MHTAHASASMDVTDPESGALVGTVARHRQADARAALDRASGARAGMADLPTHARMAALRAGAHALEAQSETVAALIASAQRGPEVRRNLAPVS